MADKFFQVTLQAQPTKAVETGPQLAECNEYNAAILLKGPTLVTFKAMVCYIR